MPRIDTSDIKKSGTNLNNTIRQTVQSINKSSVGQLSGVKSTLIPGQLVQGEVIDLRQNEVKLLLNSSDTLAATLKDIHSLSIGDRASFKVLTANNTNISLKLMNTAKNDNLTSTVEKALAGAGLPVTERNASAVEELLTARMSIDKQSIYKLLQHSSEHKDASMQTLVRLLQLGLPVDELHVQSMEAYNRYENRLLPLLDNLQNNITDILNNPALNSTERFDINSSLINFLSDYTDIAQSAVTLSAYLNESQANSLLEIIRSYIQAHPDTAGFLSADKPIADSDTAGLNTSNSDIVFDVLRSDTTITDTNKAYVSASDTLTSNMLTSDMHVSDLMSLVRELLTNEHNQLTQANQSGRPTTAENSLNTLLSAMPEYHSLITLLLESRWSVSPKQLMSDNHSPEKLLERLEREVDIFKTFERYSNHNPKDPSASGNNDGIRSNISFMQSLNEVFPYIQLPIQLKGQTVHSELFVYARKKQQGTSSSDDVSVMLHLDMESLGPLDVRIEMSKANISTKFYVNDALSEQLINENLPLLDKALAAKGYILNPEVFNHLKGRNPLEEFLASDFPDNEVKRYTFDIRA